MSNYIYEYYQKITDGEITVGNYIKLVLKYLINGLEKKEFFFNQKKANKAIIFIENFCHHHEGHLAPELITLELWQKAFISALFGIVDKDGNRQFREAILIVARKNGKTLLSSAISAYCAFLDGEYGGRIYYVAPKLQQASLCYDAFYQTIKKEPELDALCKKRRSDIYIAETNTSAMPLAFSAKKSDGLNISLCVADEIASWQGESGMRFYEVIKSSFGARKQPILLVISTAGYENDGIYDELIKRATRVLKGKSREKRLLPFLYMIDDVEKWNDINELQKSNPNLGVSVTVDYLLEEIAVAENSLSKKSEFITKYCNIKQNSSSAFLEYKDIERACEEKFSIEDFRECHCFGGIDLSQTTDLTACCLVFQKNGHFYIFSKFFLPAEMLDNATERDGLPYRQYIQQGFLRLSGDNFVDYNDCFEFYREMLDEHEVYPLMIGYDRYSANYLVKQLNGYGFHTDDVFQGNQLYPIIRNFEGLLKDGRIHIGDNSLLKVHLLNCALKMDTELNRGKLVKIHPNDHIDGAVSVIDAFTVYDKYIDKYGEMWSNE